MIIPIIVRDEAENDLLDACNWYDKQRRGLGDEFFFRIEVALESISKNPNIVPCIFENIQRKLIRRFPFGIFYTVEHNKIFIIAIMHTKRKIDNWQKRI